MGRPKKSKRPPTDMQRCRGTRRSDRYLLKIRPELTMWCETLIRYGVLKPELVADKDDPRIVVKAVTDATELFIERLNEQSGAALLHVTKASF
jgi:hypothetical protein